MTYRVHDQGPLCQVRETYRQDRPGHVIVSMEFDRIGSFVRGHVHVFDHVLRVKRGALLVSCEGYARRLMVGEEMMIVAGKRHGMTPLMPNTLAECDHEIRRENGTVDVEAFSPEGLPIEWLQRLTDKWGPEVRGGIDAV